MAMFAVAFPFIFRGFAVLIWEAMPKVPPHGTSSPLQGMPDDPVDDIMGDPLLHEKYSIISWPFL